MNGAHRAKKERATEIFRFFDDLHPTVRQAVAACNYEIGTKIHEIMSMQHKYYREGLPLEDLAADILRRDLAVFERRNEVSPDVRYPPVTVLL